MTSEFLWELSSEWRSRIADDPARAVAQRWNSLTKPPGSLGRLEPLVEQVACVQGWPSPAVERRGMYIFCADHGVTAEGVSAYPKAVTAQMVANFLRGGAAINALCRESRMQAQVIDCGVDADGVVGGARDMRVRRGSGNIRREEAMSDEELTQALTNGFDLATEAARLYDVVGVGEMGIGNTTAAAALLAAYTGYAVADCVGRGTGLDDEGVRHKMEVVRDALALHRACRLRPWSTLRCLGGLEIATMAGFMMGAVQQRVAVIVDGFISGAAALAASEMSPGLTPLLIFSHRSSERGHQLLLDYLKAKPLLELDLRLGEGSGAALAMALLSAAVRAFREMATFEEASVSGRVTS